MASPRYCRYLATDYLGRPRLDPAKVKASRWRGDPRRAAHRRFMGRLALVVIDDARRLAWSSAAEA
jgi:hypothetical protein